MDAGVRGSRLGGASAAVGGTLLATCLCAIGRIVFGAAAATTMTTLNLGVNIYTGLVVGALALIIAGLASRSRRAGAIAVGGTVLFGAGFLLAGPSVMHGMDHTAAHFAGFGLTLAGIGGLVWGYLAAFPTRNRRSATCAAGGFGAAAGCSCCLSSGALVWIGAALGIPVLGAPFADGIPFVLFMAVAVAGLYRLAGRRYALWALAGAAVAIVGDEGLKPLIADEIERLPRLLVTLAGTGLVMWAFARAFSTTRPTDPARRPTRGPSDGPTDIGGHRGPTVPVREPAGV